MLDTRRDRIGRIEQHRIAALKVTRQEIIGNQIQVLPFTRFQDNVVGRVGQVPGAPHLLRLADVGVSSLSPKARIWRGKAVAQVTVGAPHERSWLVWDSPSGGWHRRTRRVPQTDSLTRKPLGCPRRASFARLGMLVLFPAREHSHGRGFIPDKLRLSGAPPVTRATRRSRIPQRRDVRIEEIMVEVGPNRWLVRLRQGDSQRGICQTSSVLNLLAIPSVLARRTGYVCS